MTERQRGFFGIISVPKSKLKLRGIWDLKTMLQPVSSMVVMQA